MLIFAGPFERTVCGNSSVGRARPCQGRGREFESRFPLTKDRHHFGRLSFFRLSGKLFLILRPSRHARLRPGILSASVGGSVAQFSDENLANSATAADAAFGPFRASNPPHCRGCRGGNVHQGRFLHVAGGWQGGVKCIQACFCTLPPVKESISHKRRSVRPVYVD